MSSIRECSFSSKLLLGLSIFMHRKYGSKGILDILSSLGFYASYTETVNYEAAIACNPQPHISSSDTEIFVQYVGDNADINMHTIDGRDTLHVMGMIKIVTPKEELISNGRTKKVQTDQIQKN